MAFIDEDGFSHKTINDFIKELQSISEDKRELPLVILCPNGEETDPKIKMFLENGIFTKPTKINITWQ